VSGGRTPIVELGVEEAYRLLRDAFGQVDLPPLEAVENEDWGRDYLLSRLQGLSEGVLAAAGLTSRDGEGPAPPGDGGG
jgi:hypothetical protein